MTTTVDVKGISRREFLYYLWSAGAGLLGIGVCGASVWYMTPQARYGIDLFLVNPKIVPQRGEAPVGIADGKFWLSHTHHGLLALSMLCTHVRAAPTTIKWVPTNNRFECPLSGSKFHANGNYIEGPAYRNLDRYILHVTTPLGTRETSPDGEPVNVIGATNIVVDVRKPIRGKRVRGWGE